VNRINFRDRNRSRVKSRISPEIGSESRNYASGDARYLELQRKNTGVFGLKTTPPSQTH